MVPENLAKLRKTSPGALGPRINRFERNLMRKSMVSERPTRFSKTAPGASDQEMNCIGRSSTRKSMVSEDAIGSE